MNKDTSAEPPVLVRVDAPIGTIVLNRPHRRNALSGAMVADLRQAVSDLHQQQNVRAVVITGAGSAFCAGRDLHELALHSDRPAEDQQRWGEELDELMELVVDLLRLPKPVIASVNGPVYGSGAALVLACDLALATETASFALNEGRFGLVAGLAGPLLAYRIGAGLAARLMLTAEPIAPQEAYRVGIYHQIVEERHSWALAAELGRKCAAVAPEAALVSKRLLTETLGEQLLAQLASGAIAASMARTTEAAQERIDAFVERKNPQADAQEH